MLNIPKFCASFSRPSSTEIEYLAERISFHLIFHRTRFSGLLLCAVLALTGCAHRGGRNNFPVVVDKTELKALKTLVDDYRKNPAQVTVSTRNNLVERLIGVSDDHYFILRNKLLNSRNTESFIGEVTSTTLSAVAAILGDPDTKSILSTASTLTQSTKTSIDKNFFSNKSTEAIVAQMDALRADRRKAITNGESDELTSYGLETALNDVRAYDDGGTVESGMLAITASTATQKTNAEQSLADTKLKLQ